MVFVGIAATMTVYIAPSAAGRFLRVIGPLAHCLQRHSRNQEFLERHQAQIMAHFQDYGCQSTNNHWGKELLSFSLGDRCAVQCLGDDAGMPSQGSAAFNLQHRWGKKAQ